MQAQLPYRDSFYQVYRWLNMIFLIVAPAYAVFTGATTVFYILYLYWWHEFISSSLDGFYFYLHQQRNPSIAPAKNPVWGRIFMLAIYFIFIVVFFGFVSNWGSSKLVVMNMRVLMLRDAFFVTNLACIFLNELWLRHRSLVKYNDTQDPFAGRIIVLHISIIGGAVMYFWLQGEYPETFSPGNLWGSVIMAAPFLIAKAIVSWEAKPAKQPEPAKML